MPGLHIKRPPDEAVHELPTTLSPEAAAARVGFSTAARYRIEAEVTEFLDRHAVLKTDDGRTRVVRHGHLPEREMMTGIGPVAVRRPRVRDRQAAADDPTRIRFSPSILPPYT